MKKLALFARAVVVKNDEKFCYMLYNGSRV